ncbi:MAG: hypothetical protein IJF92_01760 [Bacilli bacterium]|nr:hypothetical protein [Bacilli bacterium]
MKGLKILLVITLSILLVPITAFAKDNKKVNVYFFRGKGCPHCEEAEQFFKSIEAEYGKYYTIVDYETWYNEDNAELMQKVAKERNEEATGVPYIIIGDESWNGYDTSYDDAIKAKIKKVYDQDPKTRYDVMKYVDSSKAKKDSSSDVIALILIILVAGGIGTGIYFVRKNAK